jgi:phosphatidylserine/phosphatidylglycerophosphate/cardiolipin synthase-like enzyme
VLLEKNVYKAPYLNNDVYKTLKNAWIEVKYSNAENYSLNHTKLMIVDDEAIISTWNYSYSSFKYNREFFILLKNKEFLGKLLEIFQVDFSWIRKNIYQNNLVLSPFSSRTKLEYLLKNATKSIKIYCLNFDDISIENILLEKQKSWINIQIIFPELKKVESNKELIEKFKNAWIKTKILSKPDLHAKSILIDEKYLYLWSINFSQSSIDKNREIWILLTNSDLIKYFLKIFEWDFNSKL